MLVSHAREKFLAERPASPKALSGNETSYGQNRTVACEVQVQCKRSGSLQGWECRPFAKGLDFIVYVRGKQTL